VAAPGPGARRGRFQVIVPDLRGYGRSDKPEAVEAYTLLLDFLPQ
jgi:pimeloyl-ACP methyl ester carboxylesterase